MVRMEKDRILREITLEIVSVQVRIDYLLSTSIEGGAAISTYQNRENQADQEIAPTPSYHTGSCWREEDGHENQDDI